MLRSKTAHAEKHIRQLVNAGLGIAVVVPCHNVQAHITEMVSSLPDYVRWIVLVDDASTDRTPALIEKLSRADTRICVVHLEINRGVGGAVLAGFAETLKAEADISVKMDGDGQMDPTYLPLLVEPLVTGKADYTKGNRFRDAVSLTQMPMNRRIGNAVLSFMTKIASGYWRIFDPTNGYIATRREIIELLPNRLIHPRFFFESSMLVALNLLGAVVVDVPMAARYGTERSNLNIRRVIFEFPFLLVVGFLQRMWSRKILYSLTMEAILGIFGSILLLSGFTFGVVEFVNYAIIRQVAAPAGTVMTAALPFFIGFQMVVTAIILDIQSEPSVPLCEKIVLGEMRNAN